MADIVQINPSVLTKILSSFGTEGLPLPFVKEIFLMECHIAGTSYRELKEIEPNILINDILVFNREPDNKYDERAIIIYDKNSNMLGYVPKAKNEVLANLMDAGKLIFGKIVEKNWYGEWLKMDIQTFMRD